MKKILTLIFSFFVAFSSFGQTATDFNAFICGGNYYNLFSELNTGKVVVICWVMPCTYCTPKALGANNAVQSFSASNPGQVVYYIVDDFGETLCPDLQQWVDTNVALNIQTFSDANISMAPYGSPGMPKTIVLGGVTTHSVYFNQNDSAANNFSGIQSAISQALADITAAGIKEDLVSNYQTKISPNPIGNELTLSFELRKKENLTIEIFNVLGSKVKSVENVSGIGINKIKINTEGLNNGTYFLKINNGNNSDKVKFIISH
jgi:hypothetical protein